MAEARASCNSGLSMSLSLAQHIDYLPNLPGSRPRQSIARAKPKTSYLRMMRGTSFLLEKSQVAINKQAYT